MLKPLQHFGKTSRFVPVFWSFAFFVAVGFRPAALFAADIYLQIQRGEKVMLALPDFNFKEPSEKIPAQDLRAVSKEDLLYSRIFNMTEQGPQSSGNKIDFAAWGQQGADLLVTGTVILKDSKAGSMAQLIGAVYEVPSGKPVFQKSYQIAARSSRKLAHEFVADILYRFTGNRGLSQSKVTFSNNSTGNKEIYVVDYDGENLRRLTATKKINILPRWSADGKEILFTSYRRNNPDLYLYSLDDGNTKSVSSRIGLNSAGSFSPDGKQILATLSYEGAPKLYLLDRQGNIVRKLTQGAAADTSASFSPDGRKIVYVSDRPGWPQIYIMDADGSNSQRISETGYCDSPVWSPLGDKIAYSRGTKTGEHDIVVHDLGLGSAARLTDGSGKNENPSFSPDGKFIVFTSNRNKKRELYVVAIDASTQKKLADIPGDSFTPSWGN